MDSREGHVFNGNLGRDLLSDSDRGRYLDICYLVLLINI